MPNKPCCRQPDLNQGRGCIHEQMRFRATSCGSGSERRVRTSWIYRLFGWIIADRRSGMDRRRKLDDLPAGESQYMKRKR